MQDCFLQHTSWLLYRRACKCEVHSQARGMTLTQLPVKASSNPSCQLQGELCSCSASFNAAAGHALRKAVPFCSNKLSLWVHPFQPFVANISVDWGCTSITCKYKNAYKYDNDVCRGHLSFLPFGVLSP